jgi:hypothetical protein
MKKIILLSMLAVAICFGTAKAQKPAVVVSDKTGWHKIGETKVDFEKDHDEVMVMMADRFAALKFKVTDAPLELVDLDVFFEDGTSKNVTIGYAIKNPGESSRVIDLPGSEQSIKKIAFRYKTMPNRKEKKAQVEIWGMKTNPDKANKEAKKEMKEEKREMKQDNK